MGMACTSLRLLHGGGIANIAQECHKPFFMTWGGCAKGQPVIIMEYSN